MTDPSDAPTDPAPEVPFDLKAVATAGIPPGNALSPTGVLQFTPHCEVMGLSAGVRAEVLEAANEVLRYHRLSEEQQQRIDVLTAILAGVLGRIVDLCPAGRQRSTAISRLTEAKHWASAAIALHP